MNELIEAGLSQGLGYGLFIFLLIYVLKTTGEREANYQNLISKLSESFKIIEDVKEDVKEIKSHIFKK